MKSTSGGSLYVDAATYLQASDLTNYVQYSYASSTFPSFSYASNTFATILNYPTYSYGSSTYATIANYPTYTYASNTFATLLNTPSFTYGSSTYVNYSYASSTFPSFSYASSTYQPAGTYVTSVSGSGSILSSGGTTPTIQLQNLTANDILFGQGNNTIATSSNFTFNSSTNVLTVTNASTSALTVSGPAWITGLFSVTGTSTLATTSISQLTVSGQTSLGNASSSALTVSGPLLVTGQSSLANASTSNLTVSSNTYLNGLTATGQTTLGNASTSNLTVSGNSYLGTILSGTWNGGVIGVSYGGTGTTTAPTVQGQILAADSTGTKYAPANLVAGSNITITTTTPGQITIAMGGSSVSGSGTVGFDAIWNGTNSLTTGKLINNGTVLGVNASSSTVTFNLQGNAGNVDPFNVASSSGSSLLIVKANGNVGIGTTTPLALLSLPLGTTASNGINFGDATANLYRSAAGTLKTDGSLNTAGTSYDVSGITALASLSLKGQQQNIPTFEVKINSNSTQNYTTSIGQILLVGDASSFIPTSGNGIWNIQENNGTVNQTGSANGVSRGLYLNPTLTSTYDYRNLETAAGLVNNVSNLAPASTVYNVLFNPITYQTASSSKYSITNASTLTISGAPIASTTS